jgi:PDZ domain-containing protein
MRLKPIVLSGLTTLVVVAAIVFARQPQSYVIEQPGPVFNVLGSTAGKKVITVDGAESYPVSGELDALTVQLVGSPDDKPTWLEVALARLDPSKTVTPMSEVYPTGVKTSVINASDLADMQASQQDAQAAALNYLGIKFNSRVYVQSMMSDSAAMGLIKPGDYIVSLNGEKMNDGDVLRARVKAWDGKAPLEVGIERNGKQSVVSITPKKVEGRYYIGVYIGYKYVFPFKTSVYLGDVGGPSAGTMFAIGIIDKLTPGALLKGLHVAGTGTIEPTGQVGPIGGIVQKMYAAKNSGATVFLAPSDNCAETVGKTPQGLNVYRIKNLSQAMEILNALHDGRPLSGFATCGK